MKTIPLIAISFLLAILVSAIGIISVQNATPVSLNFTLFQSIPMPVGVVLAISLSVGILGGAILQPLWMLSASEPVTDRAELEEDI
ncbi:LapA family protein [Microcoleus sp. EPA2]|uniref:LapA family protein n=1 Tax=Microcoleus sp. EPA2 TaxID=2841654 RepID=UPI00312BB501